MEVIERLTLGQLLEFAKHVPSHLRLFGNDDNGIPTVQLWEPWVLADTWKLWGEIEIIPTTPGEPVLTIYTRNGERYMGLNGQITDARD